MLSTDRVLRGGNDFHPFAHSIAGGDPDREPLDYQYSFPFLLGYTDEVHGRGFALSAEHF